MNKHGRVAICGAISEYNRVGYPRQACKFSAVKQCITLCFRSCEFSNPKEAVNCSGIYNY